MVEALRKIAAVSAIPGIEDHLKAVSEAPTLGKLVEQSVPTNPKGVKAARIAKSATHLRKAIPGKDPADAVIKGKEAAGAAAGVGGSADGAGLLEESADGAVAEEGSADGADLDEKLQQELVQLGKLEDDLGVYGLTLAQFYRPSHERANHLRNQLGA